MVTEHDSFLKSKVVQVLSETMAGAAVPPDMVRRALTIRSGMIKAGTWGRA